MSVNFRLHTYFYCYLLNHKIDTKSLQLLKIPRRYLTYFYLLSNISVNVVISIDLS